MGNTVAARIFELISILNENTNSFSGKIGVTRSTIQTAMKRNKGVNTDLILKIHEAFPNVSTEWLLTGNGEALKDEISSSVKAHDISNAIVLSGKNTGNHHIGDHTVTNNLTLPEEGSVKIIKPDGTFEVYRVDPKQNFGDIALQLNENEHLKKALAQQEKISVMLEETVISLKERITRLEKELSKFTHQG